MNCEQYITYLLTYLLIYLLYPMRGFAVTRWTPRIRHCFAGMARRTLSWYMRFRTASDPRATPNATMASPANIRYPCQVAIATVAGVAPPPPPWKHGIAALVAFSIPTPADDIVWFACNLSQTHNNSVQRCSRMIKSIKLYLKNVVVVKWRTNVVRRLKNC